ncbi:MAG: hypothetical protein P4M00_06705 [Azospirillaceae bacterium]|nr:hypothetical protein [Azospirillaceae bacterium]
MAESVLDQVTRLSAELTRARQLELLRVIEHGAIKDDAATETVSRALIRTLNGRRTAHARRLWTQWFESVMARDPETLTLERRLAAHIHEIDISAWWQTLAAVPDGPLLARAKRIQTAVSQQAESRLVEDVLASLDGRIWAEDLRQASITALEALLADPSRRTAVLAEVNRQRSELVRSRSWSMAIAPLEAADLGWLLTSLKLARDLPPLGQAPTGQVGVTNLIDRVRAMPETGPDGAMIAALARLHVRREPSYLVTLYQGWPITEIAEAGAGHFEAATRRLIAGMIRQLDPDGTTVTTTATDLDVELATVFEWFDAVQALGLEHHRATAAPIRFVMSLLLTAVEDRLIPGLSKRIAALNPRIPLTPLIYAAQWIGAFYGELRARGLAVSATPWPSRLGDHLNRMFTRIAGGLDGPLPALLQIADLAEALSQPIPISALDLTTFKAIETLVAKATVTSPPHPLIVRVIAIARDERRKSRYWIDPVIAALLEAVDRKMVNAPE